MGAVAFCLALGFKQMALYYALPVFFYLLGQCRQPRHGLGLLLRLGVTVVITFSLMFLPFLHPDLLIVLRRIFPVARGLFEDKVANVWCAVDILIKLRKLFSIPMLIRASAVVTLLACLPACLPLLSLVHLPPRRAVRLFPTALAAASLAFFLFSFQVHEKSILLPLLPITLLYPFEPKLVQWFTTFFHMEYDPAVEARWM